jgi:hypothetical protein
VRANTLRRPRVHSTRARAGVRGFSDGAFSPSALLYAPTPRPPSPGAGNCMRAEGPEIYQPGASPQIVAAGERTRAEGPIHYSIPNMALNELDSVFHENGPLLLLRIARGRAPPAHRYRQSPQSSPDESGLQPWIVMCGHDTQAVGLGWYEDAPSVLENENVRHNDAAAMIDLCVGNAPSRIVSSTIPRESKNSSGPFPGQRSRDRPSLR